MQGKTNADLEDEREMAERKMLMEEQIRRNAELAERGMSLHDEFDNFSEVSQPVDEILRVRAQDPRTMKPGQESKDVAGPNAFFNKNLFRQAETITMKQRIAMKSKEFDTSMETFLTDFCTHIQKEIEEAAQAQRKNLTAESLVDRYGLKTRGYIEYEEFL